MYINLSIDLEGKKVSIVGAGKLALRRARSLASSKCQLYIISPQIDKGFESLDHIYIGDSYKRKYIEDSFLVLATTDNKQVNLQIYKDCQDLGILVNVADGSVKSPVIFPAQAGPGLLSIGVSSSGYYPLLSKKIKDDLRANYGHYNDDYIIRLGQIREMVLALKLENKEEILRRLLEFDLQELMDYKEELEEKYEINNRV